MEANRLEWKTTIKYSGVNSNFYYLVHTKWFTLHWCYQSGHRRQYSKFNNSSIFKCNIGHVHSQNVVARDEKICPIFEIRILIISCL